MNAVDIQDCIGFSLGDGYCVKDKQSIGGL